MTDITYIATGEGWLCLTGIKDVITRELVGLRDGLAHDANGDGNGTLEGGAQQAAGSRLDSSFRSCSQYCAHDYQTG
jgi:transposase InsO family protein